jgi:hypothetical protein
VARFCQVFCLLGYDIQTRAPCRRMPMMTQVRPITAATDASRSASAYRLRPNAPTHHSALQSPLPAKRKVLPAGKVPEAVWTLSVCSRRDSKGTFSFLNRASLRCFEWRSSAKRRDSCGRQDSYLSTILPDTASKRQQAKWKDSITGKAEICRFPLSPYGTGSNRHFGVTGI